jgi:hypothetical protein
MSERDTSEHENRVSPYLLRPARTYEEYLRDRESSDQVMEQLERASSHKNKTFKTETALSRSGERDRRDTANNQA